MIGDVFDLTATYAVVIAVGRGFNDTNKRTVLVSMDARLKIGVQLSKWSCFNCVIWIILPILMNIVWYFYPCPAPLRLTVQAIKP